MSEVIKNNQIPEEIKDICRSCEENIHCQNKGCAFRSLGNEYCDYVLNATKLYLDLQQKVEQLEKEVNEYQKELEKADSITQSCIFQGKQESEISFRNCLNKLEQLEKELKEANDSISWWSNRFKAVKRDNKQLENIIKEAINKLKEHRYDLDYMPWVIYKIKGSILFELTETLNKGSYKDV